MKKIIFLLAFLAFIAMNAEAQVTIGSNEQPGSGAILDLNEGKTTNKDESEKGLLLPRVKLTSTDHKLSDQTTHVAGMVVYNKETNTSNSDTSKWVYPGYYYNDGTQWLRMEARNSNWFYMPSIPLQTQYKDGETQIEVDLYGEYVKQFKGLDPLQFKASPGAPTQVSTVPDKTDLYYFITKYDNSVFDIVNLTNEGKLTYKLKDTGTVSDTTMMNIVFLLK